jgi:hypothetical protein
MKNIMMAVMVSVVGSSLHAGDSQDQRYTVTSTTAEVIEKPEKPKAFDFKLLYRPCGCYKGFLYLCKTKIGSLDCIAFAVGISELFNGFSIEYKDLEDVAKEQRKHIEKRSAEFGVELEKFEIPANDFDILRKNVLRQDEQLKKLAYHLNMGEIPQLPDFDAYDINLFYEGKIVIHHH